MEAMLKKTFGLRSVFIVLIFLFLVAAGAGAYISRQGGDRLTQNALLSQVEPDATRIFRKVWVGNDYVLKNVATLQVSISNSDPTWATIHFIAGPNLDPAFNWIVIHLKTGQWHQVRECGPGTTGQEAIDNCRDQAIPKAARGGTWTQRDFPFKANPRN